MKFRILRRPALLCAIGLLAVACSKDELDLTGSIHGTVTDAKTGEPLAGAVIDLVPDHRTGTTGADGSFAFDALTTNTYTVQAKREGYRTDTRTPHVEAGSNVTVDFALQPLADESATQQ